MARRMNPRPFFGVGLIIGLLAIRIAVAAEPAADLLGQMEKAMADVRTVKTDFVQEKKMALFNHPLVTRGSIWVEPPNRLLWRVESPMRYALALDGSRIRQWDGETGKTTSLSMDGNPVFAAVTEQLIDDFAVVFDDEERIAQVAEAFQGVEQTAVVAGMLVAGITGYFAIKVMIDAIKKKKLTGFVIYTGILGALVLVDQYVTHYFF